MTNTIFEQDAIDALAATDVLAVDDASDSNITKKVSATQIATYVLTGNAASFTTVAASNDVTIANGKAIQTSTTTGHTVVLKAYDVNGTAYKTFLTLTNADTPSMAIAAPSGGAVTIDGASIGATTAGSGAFTTLTASTPIGAASGGTGVANNAASTITISGNFASTFTVSGVTAVTFPTSGTLTTLATVVSTANTFTKAQRSAFVTLTDAATVALDLSLSNNFNLVLGGNRTLGVPTNAVAGQTGCINVRQDITGSRTLAYAWPYVFPIGTAPTLSTGKLVPDELYYKVNAYSTATVTVTIATPGVMTWTSHGLMSGQRIQLTTTGALPTGLTASTTYWVTVIDANTFNLSTSMANAQAATFIATSGSQSGTHTAVAFSITISNNLGVA